MKLFRRYTTAVLVAALLLNASAFGQHHPRFDTIRERIDNWTYPSIGSAWAGIGWLPVVGRGDLGDDAEILALYDVHFTSSWGGYNWHIKSDGLVEVGSKQRAEQQQLSIIAHNPNRIFLKSIRMRDAFAGYFPDDSPFWIRDPETNKLVDSEWPGAYLIDFTNPDFQDLIVRQAILAAESGLYDGVFFDWWNEAWYVLRHYRTNDQEQEARDTILRRIRGDVHPDFLIMVNANWHKERAQRNAHLINGAFMETSPNDGIGYTRERILKIEDSLLWFSRNFREPRTILLEGRTRNMPFADLNSPEVRQWMRLFTTMSLTHSDGSVLYARKPAHRGTWYDFWDVDLGKPVSPIAEEYEDKTGVFIREFTNGWAVYNRSGESQPIVLPHVVTAVSTQKEDAIFEIPDMDGEIFVYTGNPTSVSIRDLLTTRWGTIKTGALKK